MELMDVKAALSSEQRTQLAVAYDDGKIYRVTNNAFAIPRCDHKCRNARSSITLGLPIDNDILQRSRKVEHTVSARIIWFVGKISNM